jgi:hypothetical protein
MNTLVDRFSAAGVRFRLEGEKVIASGFITPDLLKHMREVKAEIAAELQAVEDRRRRLLALLAEQPERRYVLIYDTDASTEYDVLVMAIPEATFEVRVPKPADSLEFGVRLMQMLDKHGEAKA